MTGPPRETSYKFPLMYKISCCLVGFYGISTIVGYLMANPFYTIISNCLPVLIERRTLRKKNITKKYSKVFNVFLNQKLLKS